CLGLYSVARTMIGTQPSRSADSSSAATWRVSPPPRHERLHTPICLPPLEPDARACTVRSLPLRRVSKLQLGSSWLTSSIALWSNRASASSSLRRRLCPLGAEVVPALLEVGQLEVRRRR